jgi:glycosyltransferase involved in cell wall biosynthesis
VKPLLVDLELAWRGGQNQALLLLKGLRSRGHAPELLAADGSALGERAQSIGVPVHFVSRGGFRLPAARQIRSLLHTGQYDLLHANEAHAVSAAWLARSHKHVPVVISRRVGYPIGKSRIARARYIAAGRIIANSEWVARQAADSGAPREKISVVYEGAEIPAPFTSQQKRDGRRRWNVADKEILLGCVGVLLPDKGQEFLIRALAVLHHESRQRSRQGMGPESRQESEPESPQESRSEPTPELRSQLRQTEPKSRADSRAEFPATKLLLAGDGPCRPQLESLAKQLGVAESVVFAGFVKDVESVYAALDVFLLPSLFEALNNSLLAAMAYEIPSIAFDRGALGEIIQDGVSGKLVPATDIAALSGAIAALLNHPDTARSLGLAGRDRVIENFSADRMVEETLHIYRQILSR